MMIRRDTIAWLIAMLGVGGMVCAEEGGKVEWAGQDRAGVALKVPGEGKASLLVFARGGQEQSREAMEQIKKAVEKESVQVIVVVSGPEAGERGKAMAGEWGWPIVVDGGFEMAGRMDVHAWPTTVMVGADGVRVSHRAGYPPSFVADLSADLDYVAGRIDAAGWKQRLEEHQVVSDSAKQKASRHLRVARMLLGQGDVEQAKGELEAGMKLDLENWELQLAMAEVLLVQKQAGEALQILDGLALLQRPEVVLMRVRALIELERWGAAKAILQEALKGVDAPAGAHYLMGRVWEQEKDFARASGEYRAACDGAMGR